MNSPTRFPEEPAKFDECLVDTLDQGPARLVFVGRHTLRFVGRVNPVSAGSPPRARLLSAKHSRLGDVLQALATVGGSSTVIGPGDTLMLEFEAPPIVDDEERDVFVLSRGVYSAASPLNQQSIGIAPLRLRFALEQNVPNPFATATRIGFALAERSAVQLTVYDPQGRQVRRLGSGEWPAGRHELAWDRRNDGGGALRPGVYLYELVAGRNHARRKLVVLP